MGHFFENQEEIHKWYYLTEVSSLHVNGTELDKFIFFRFKNFNFCFTENGCYFAVVRNRRAQF